MNNVISIREIRIKLALKEATVALVKARTLISDGKVRTSYEKEKTGR